MPTRGTGRAEAWLSKRRHRMASKLIPYGLRRHGKLLDIGGGASTDGLGFHTRLCIDPNHDGRGLEYLKGLPSESFDAVVMLAVIEHVWWTDALDLVREAHRLLRPGGLIVVTTPPPWTEVPLRVLSRLGIVSREEIDEHKMHYEKGAIMALFSGAGFLFGGSGLFLGGMNRWAWALK